MKRSTFIRLALGASATVGAGLPSLPTAISRGEPAADVPPVAKNRSLQLEIEHSIEKGLAYLKTRQDPAGFWSSADYPALSGLVLLAFVDEPSGTIKTKHPDFVEKGYGYLMSCVKPDGGIYGNALANYNTSVVVLALNAADSEKYDSVLRKARAFLVGQQNFYPKQDGKMNPYEGGIGYGDDGPHSDVSNTVFAMEALRKTQSLLEGRDAAAAHDLNWDAALAFLQRCQNLPKTNAQPWVTGDPKNVGGFIYTPLAGDNHAEDDMDGKKVPRSYGSMSYSGLLSYIYADLTRDDPRVTAVYDWLGRNYTVEENPGLGASGLFYYYHTMSKALSTYGADQLTLAGGKTANWREDLALKLIDLQAGEGSWVNDKSGRWWEKDPVLVTSYAVRTLEMMHAGV
ncbi:MAG TPA: prenyltransferase/squalene oxidase repeat-containing protein [Candidatus Methylacidiphilales bacterium]|jgi:squalene-hopene/tetraprenyl-beta-curcumene cyclase|nr:prenyltransferase/squalene oxidase repeat-containing protein [Candidatus Methylacidiphilales bacterium]